MRLIEDWRHVLKHAWSIRFTVLAALLSGVEIVLPMFNDALPRGVFAVLTLLVTVAAAVARLVPQPKMRGEK